MRHDKLSAFSVSHASCVLFETTIADERRRYQFGKARLPCCARGFSLTLVGATRQNLLPRNQFAVSDNFVQRLM